MFVTCSFVAMVLVLVCLVEVVDFGVLVLVDCWVFCVL